MIERLTISAELKTVLAERGAYHENRADAYQRSVVSMETSEDERLDESLSNDTDHLNPDEVCRRAEDDLFKLS